MKFIEKRQKIDYLLKLIENENTGTAEELCNRIYVSKSTFKRYLVDLREMGYKISFCSQRSTYYMINELKKSG